MPVLPSSLNYHEKLIVELIKYISKSDVNGLSTQVKAAYKDYKGDIELFGGKF